MLEEIDQIVRWDETWAVQFPKRLSRRQKNDFLAALEQDLALRGFETERIEVRQIVRCVNLVTRCESPRIIFMAHYDTPTILPFWLAWLFKFVGHTRQISGMILMILLLMAPSLLGLPATAVNLFQLFIILTLLTLLIPNPHNREDNTSGVLGLMALADWLKDKPEIRKQVQLVCTDNEELGLLGASGLKKVWKKQGHPFQNAAIINLDCIARGKVPLLVYHRQQRLANQLLPYLLRHLPNMRPKDMTIVALSDNYIFRKTGAVDISFADRTIIPGGFFIPRIHSPADNDFDVNKFVLLIQGLTDYLKDTNQNE